VAGLRLRMERGANHVLDLIDKGYRATPCGSGRCGGSPMCERAIGRGLKR